ncbi:CHRNA6 [Mytilus edulis]|uniref:CHRNA6 n=1 Tax=Mytilus edulis TaxID=6550 RepID=A0A8S3V1J4_MYTED|nr:CHRNA6 [Mytilus edulis]
MKSSFVFTVILAMTKFSLFKTQTEYHDKFRTYLSDVIEQESVHDARIRPMTDQANAVDISVEFQIISISKLDTFSGSMDFAGRLKMKWTSEEEIVRPDEQRNWLDFDARLVEQDSIWTPDITVYNSMGERKRLGDSSFRIQIDMDGRCEWLLGVVDSTSCMFDVTLFPFDKPICNIVFTTWKYKAAEVLLSALNDSVDMSLYNENSEWTIVNTTSNLTIQNEVSYLNYTIYFKREAGFVLVNMILPVIVVSLLNALVFLVPAESGERLTYAVLLFLWFAVYLDIISTNLPISSDNMSNLSLFVISMVGLSILTIFLDVISVMLYNRDDKKQVPWCIEGFVRCLRCRCGGSNRNRIIPFEDVESFDQNGDTQMLNGKAPTTVALGTKSNNKVELRLRDFEMPRDDLKRKENIENEPRKRKSDEVDWKVVSVTFDYICFVLTLLCTLGLCGYFLVPLVTANS